MKKKYIVRLTDAERQTLQNVIKKLKGSSLKVRRAQVLLKADVDGPALTDKQIAEALGCRTKTVANNRQRVVSEGFEVTLDGKPREEPSRPPIFDGEQEAKLIALRLPTSPNCCETERRCRKPRSWLGIPTSR